MKPVTIDTDRLLRTLEQEELDSTTYHESELAREQADGLKRYFGEPYGDEVENRSRVVTRDVRDAVNWILPHILRHIRENDELISVDDPQLDDGDQVLEDAGNLLRHTLFQDNPGDVILHDYLFDGMVSKLGVLRTVWEPAEEEPEDTLEGLTMDQVMRYANDPQYQIMGAEMNGEIEQDLPQAGPVPMLPRPAAGPHGMPVGLMPQVGAPQPGGLLGMAAPGMGGLAVPMGPEPTFTLRVQRTRPGKVLIEAMAPENFRIARRAKSVASAPYHAGLFDAWLADVVSAHPEKRHELDPNHAWEAEESTINGNGATADERVTARFQAEVSSMARDTTLEAERRRVVVRIEYIRGDFDRDGTTELRRIKRCGKVILENEIVKESEFTEWSPVRVSHRAIGLSVADMLMDIQAIRTSLTRKALDGLTQALAPRIAIDQRALGEDDDLIDRMLDHEVGDVLPVNGDPSKIFFPLVTPDTSASAMQWVTYFDQRSAEASGVNPHTMGMRPEGITDTKGGIENLQSAGGARIEQYARWAVLGIQEALNKVLRLYARHQDQPRMVKVNGRRLAIDPRRWSDEMTVSVHVAMAADSREKRLMFLNALAQKQEQVLAMAGPGNPLVPLKNYRNTLAKMAVAMGERDPSAYFAEIPDNWQPPPPGPDAKVMEAQGKLQLAQAEAGHKAQLEQAKLQHAAQMKEAEFQRDLQLQAAKLQADKAIQVQEMQHKQAMLEAQLMAEARVAQAKTEAEMALGRERLAMEMELARWKTAQEVRLKREQIAANDTQPGGGSGVGGDDGISTGVRFGGDVG